MKALWTGVVASAMAFAGWFPGSCGGGGCFSFQTWFRGGSDPASRPRLAARYRPATWGRSEHAREVFDLPPTTDFNAVHASTPRTHRSFQPGTGDLTTKVNGRAYWM